MIYTYKKHPKYLGKVKPRVLCEACWFLHFWVKLKAKND